MRVFDVILAIGLNKFLNKKSIREWFVTYDFWIQALIEIWKIFTLDHQNKIWPIYNNVTRASRRLNSRKPKIANRLFNSFFRLITHQHQTPVLLAFVREIHWCPVGPLPQGQ